MKDVNVYLTFDGNCRDAMKFYEKCLGGELQIMPFAEAPFDVPKDAKDKVMHAHLHNGNAVIMASDPMPGTLVRQGNNFAVCIQCESAEEIDRLFNGLGEGGKVTMGLQDTFWGSRFGMLTDRFGINWMFNFEKPKA